MKNLPIDAPDKSERLPMYKLEELITSDYSTMITFFLNES